MIIIPIKFEYDIESETRRVKETLDKLEWFTKNNYMLRLPNGIKDLGNPGIDIIKKSVEMEFNPVVYQMAERAILKSWEGNNSKIRKINQAMPGSYLLDELNVILTMYGTQGSYRTPNSVIINIYNIPPEFLIKTVIHESLHLMIEHLIKKYSVEHWVKERVINLIMDLEYKSRFKMGHCPEWALPTDVIFKEYYPDIISIMDKVSSISPKK